MDIKTSGYIEKATKLQDGEVEFVVSTGALDAHGERINVDGINTKEYMKNPVVLWGHDSFNLPIAKTTKIWKEGGKLMARAKFYLKDQFASKVYNYILDGYLQACSIGGGVEAWGNDGITIDKLNMKEFSVVSIPANGEALVASKSLSGDQKAELRALANNYARKMLDDGNNDGLKRDINNLKSLVATLEEVVSHEPEEDTAKSNHVRVVLRQAQAVDHQIEQVIKVVKLKGVSNE